MADASHSILATQLTTGGLVVMILEWLKGKKWAPFISHYAPMLNKVTALVVSLVTAAGISYQWDAHNHTLMLGNLALGSIAAGLWIAVKQWVFQEMIYRGMVQAPTVAADKVVEKVAPAVVAPPAPIAPIP